ncbi:methyl-accepting chemotaxis protein [Cohnella sp. AR92]|uniref:methyl-accepting chemotaxis protein n=1 Tax=Cohnella sp. AR92 TaxID=648716 RepID=UPI000F8DB5D8|nr:methyl-accepting chemotaxis protein [Cohnella sp. AR92]RUS42211.1 methyl-accepting chemotaxis protein [Cohnella sp. AR92]
MQPIVNKKRSLKQLFVIRKLAVRYMLSTLLISILIVVSMSLAMYIPNSKATKDQIEKELALEGQTIAQKVDLEIQGKLQKLEALAKVGETFGTDAKMHQELITRFVRANPEFAGAAFSLDPSGRTAYDDKGKPQDLTKRPYIPSVAEGKTYISDPIVSVTDPSQLVIAFAIPLLQDGRAYGFYATSYPITQFSAEFNQVKIGSSGYALMADHNGLIVYHPDPEIALKKTVEEMGIPRLTEAYHKAAAGESVNYEYTFKGVEKLGFATTTRNGFTVLLAEPSSEAMAPVMRMMKIMIVAASIVTLAVLALAYAFGRNNARPIVKISGIVKQLAQGDLRPRLSIASKDELGTLGENMNEMLASLSTTIGQVNEAAMSVASSSQQITASTEEVATGSVDQADRARTMAHLFEELDSSIQQVASNANEAKGLSQTTVSIATEGNRMIGGSIEKMEQVNRQMELLEQDSSRIGDIIEVINEIAEQTNLLALNAAIEAARAGEQGKGFAVVANEVRKLAERSGAATKQIAGIIRGMQNSTSNCSTSVGEGLAQFEQARLSFEDIVRKVNETSLKVNEISTSCTSQASRASDMMREIESVAAISEEAAAAAEETAAASQELANLAEKLNGSVEMFKYR